MTVDHPSSPDGLSNTNKGKWNVNARTLTSLILVLIALSSIAYSVHSWSQSRNLKSDIAAQETQIQSLSKQVKSLKETQVTNSPAAPEKPIIGQIGKDIDTKSGRLVVRDYRKTSLHELASNTSSTDAILLVSLTIMNTTTITQTYTANQFTYIDTSKVQNGNIRAGFLESVGINGTLDSVTIDPNGSVQKDILFPKYDSGQAILKWTNGSGQEIRVTLPGL